MCLILHDIVGIPEVFGWLAKREHGRVFICICVEYEQCSLFSLAGWSAGYDSWQFRVGNGTWSVKGMRSITWWNHITKYLVFYENFPQTNSIAGNNDESSCHFSTIFCILYWDCAGHKMLRAGTWQSSRKAIPFLFLLPEHRCRIERASRLRLDDI